MKALVLEANARLVCREHELRVVEGWYRLKIVAAGICGSDLGRGFNSGAYHYPLVMGHEFSAVVEEAPQSGRFAPGARVAVYPLLPCGTCAPCQKGHIQLCLNYDYFGSRRDGAFAQALYAPESHLLPIPDDVSLEEAALCEPAAVAYHGVSMHPVAPGRTALVIGGGPIGLIAAQWLRIKGCTSIAVADIEEAKLDFAATFGFTAIDSQKLDNFADAFDYVAEACGLAITRRAAIACCARKGHVFFIGNPADDWTLEKAFFSSILRREISFTGAWNSVPDPDWKTVLAHAGKDLDLKPLITGRTSLEDAPAMFDRLIRHEGFHCKTLILPNGDIE
jgi:L-iditol 2-dehydrogenase/galactitol-1-phosphate 5-dehydrogenase